MELSKKESWETDRPTYEGKTERGIRLYVGENYGALRVVIDMYHQCDEWEITDAPVDNPDKAVDELEAFIKELEEVRDFMQSQRFEEICQEVENGVS